MQETSRKVKLEDIGEFGFIDSIKELSKIRPHGVERGIGDDCAVIRTDCAGALLVTKDLFIEGVHFLRHWGNPATLGHKALAVNLSDIAACGGIPRDAFVGIGLPADVKYEWVRDFYDGMATLAREWDTNILGGDTTGSRRDIVVSVTVTGWVGESEVLLRDGARPGDIVALTGKIGESAAGRDILLEALDIPGNIADPLQQAHLSPRPHVKEGRTLALSGHCRAAIDISDGLSSDLGHICRQSGVGAVIDQDKLPRSAHLSEIGRLLSRDPLEWMLHGGEDYALIAAITPAGFHGIEKDFRRLGMELYEIGVFTPEPGMFLQTSKGPRLSLVPHGWDHFAKR